MLIEAQIAQSLYFKLPIEMLISDKRKKATKQKLFNMRKYIILSAILLAYCAPAGTTTHLNGYLVPAPSPTSTLKIDQGDGDYTFVSYTQDMAKAYGLPSQGISNLSPYLHYVEVQTVGLKNPNKLTEKGYRGRTVKQPSCYFMMLVSSSEDLVRLDHTSLQSLSLYYAHQLNPLFINSSTPTSMNSIFKPYYKKISMTSNHHRKGWPTTTMRALDPRFVKNFVHGKDLLIFEKSCSSLIKYSDLGINLGIDINLANSLQAPYSEENLRPKKEFESASYEERFRSFILPSSLQNSLTNLIKSFE